VIILHIYVALQIKQYFIRKEYQLRSDYFAYLCSPASETMFHQKRISTLDQSHL
jgi:hypothetical protein